MLFIPVFETANAQQFSREYRITGKYLNFPVAMNQERQRVDFLEGNDSLTYSVIRIGDQPDYWVFKDVSAYKGRTLTVRFSRNTPALDMIFVADTFPGQDSLYRESLRPQFHFSSQRGWNNDPNGLVWFDGEYHLFYQHNPYEIWWENMHWGHAVSPDLIHWKELNDALFPDALGTMFSGSAVIDRNNTAGWGKNTLVAAYTADKAGREVQCVASSTDKGRTFRKYEGNPVAGRDRDPRVFWYEPNKEWVMVLYKIAGISFFTSKNLKDWKEESHIPGFYECPEFFQLPVDGNPQKTLWVLTAASGTYMLGDFDGRRFTPKFGKYRTTYGAQYAAQTYSNTPDGRRIQIGWGQIEAKGMPFNQMMCFPTVLTLRTTNEGIRLFSEPVPEVSSLHVKTYDFSGLSAAEANEKLKAIGSSLLHVVARFESVSGARISIDFNGNRYADMDADELNGVQVAMENPGSLVFDVEMLIDKTSVETYFQNGKAVFVQPLRKPASANGLQIIGENSNIRVKSLVVYEMGSIWN
jgi:sucrose-6-phosphate hydrolase SacC (GH32 family)